MGNSYHGKFEELNQLQGGALPSTTVEEVVERRLSNLLLTHRISSGVFGRSASHLPSEVLPVTFWNHSTSFDCWPRRCLIFSSRFLFLWGFWKNFPHLYLHKKRSPSDYLLLRYRWLDLWWEREKHAMWRWRDKNCFIYSVLEYIIKYYILYDSHQFE